jgi:hypothetical protein
MKTTYAVGRTHCAAGPRMLSTCVALLLALTACASTQNEKYVTSWGEITVAPGVTGTCQSNPCRVFFRMPKGAGTYTVTGNAMVYGTYPAGKTVSLGSLFESNSIKVPDAGVPPAYVYVPHSQ